MPLPVGPPPSNDNNTPKTPKKNNSGINYNKVTNPATVKAEYMDSGTTNVRKTATPTAGVTRATKRPSTVNNSVNTNKKSTPSMNKNVTEHKNYFSEIIDGEEWRTDKQTNRRYKVLPPTEWNEDGTSVCHMDDVDGLTDLNSAASTYLSHLQVPPTKKELSEMRAENAAKRKTKEL